MMTDWISEFISEVQPLRREPGFDNWDSIFSQLGTELPADYVSLVSQFGGGVVAGELWIFEPGHPNPNHNLVEQVELMRGLIQDAWDESVPKPEYMQKSLLSLIAWGGTGSAEILFWLNDSDQPDSWRIVIWNAEDSTCELMDMSFAEFIVRSLRGEIPEEKFFSSYHYDDDHALQPWPK